MNEKFLQLEQEKQRRILNAGYRVFAENAYAKAPMSEIAGAAGISKALLFHYFHNKLELYTDLWAHCVQITSAALREADVLETDDLFVMLRRSARAKCGLMERYPYLGAFSLRAYYEREPQVQTAIRGDFDRQSQKSLELLLTRVDRSRLRPEISLEQIYQEILWMTDGYMYHHYLTGRLDPAQIRRDFDRLIDHWALLYGRRED
ncbi:MAG: TetR/AcrR family transcriptional regulator [Candidatus Onthomonas sp.]